MIKSFLKRLLKQGLTHYINPVVRPSPFARAQPYHPDRYQVTMVTGVGVMRESLLYKPLKYFLVFQELNPTLNTNLTSDKLSLF